MIKRRKKKRPMNFELNLTSMIDCLSILIIYLLMAAVFTKTDVIQTKQALGTEAEASDKETKSLWVEIIGDSQVKVTSKGTGKDNIQRTVELSKLQFFASEVKAKYPDMATALVFPKDTSNYAVMIKTMDLLKKAQFRDVGLAPL